jgi:hypothetical protein
MDALSKREITDSQKVLINTIPNNIKEDRLNVKHKEILRFGNERNTSAC